jgi:glycosyltransferase involved in cell wall biosynthesis
MQERRLRTEGRRRPESGEKDGSVSNAYGDTQEAVRTLAGATILQIVPALREGPVARTALNVAQALLQWGARAMIAAEEGPLAAELKSFGGEWIPLVNDTANLFKLRRSARVLEELIAGERVDIVHAQSAGGAWCAHLAASQIAVWLVTTLPDVPPKSRLRAFWASSLARGDRVIAPSSFVATAMMERYRLPRERITIVPRGIDTATYDPAAVDARRISALCTAWKISDDARIVLAPGRVAPWNGQLLLPAVARKLVDAGMPNVVFVLAGESRSHKKYARSILDQAKTHGVQRMFRLIGHCRDMPAAFATADVVAVPATQSPVLGRVVAQAQAMGRPVVTTDVGILPEHVVTPPEMPEDVRTGWVVKPGDPEAFARALQTALSLDDTAYRAMCARARQFAEYMFSPQSVAAATRAVYTSLLARDT